MRFFPVTKSIDRYISFRSEHHLKKFCNTLNSVGIIGFHHDISFPHGELSMLTTEKTIFKVYFNKRLPAVYTDENGRTLKSGVYLDSYLVKNHKPLESRLQRFLAEFKANRSIHILEEDNDCQHFYHFVFHQTQESEFLHWIMNNLYVLHNFLEKYKLKSQDLINEAKQPANRIVLPIEQNYHENNPLSSIDTDNTHLYVAHKDTKIRVYLSKQQSICLIFLMQGKTAKEIAGRMGLSHRTVQHYLERIKKILGCHSLKELIIAYGDQVSSAPPVI